MITMNDLWRALTPFAHVSVRPYPVTMGANTTNYTLRLAFAQE